MPPPSVALPDLLGRGNLRQAAVLLERPAPAVDRAGADALDLAVRLLGCMSDRACGGPERAWYRLGALAELLHEHCGVPVERTGDGAVLVRLEHLAPQHCPHVWVARLVWREQQELLAFSSRIRQHPHKARAMAALAMVDYLSWVEHDPWRGRHPRLALSLAVEEQWWGRPRTTLLEAATGLRHLADPHLGDVSRAVWAKAGGFPGLRDRALVELGTHETLFVPTPPALHAGLPVRAGLEIACHCARVRAESE